MKFEWFVALRFLREGRTQTALILTGVAVGVATIVFLSALINGLQESIISRTLGNQAHIVVRPLEEIPRTVGLDSLAKTKCSANRRDEEASVGRAVHCPDPPPRNPCSSKAR